MNDMLNPNTMVEATRLTRAGRLTEATALLQRMLRGEAAPNVTFGAAGDIASPRRKSPTSIDTTTAVDKADRSPSSRFGVEGRSAGMSFASAAPTAQPHLFRRLSALLRLKRPGPVVGLHGLERPTPVSTPDIVPEGGKFIEATYSNPAEAVLTSCTSPAAITGRRSLWWSCCTAAPSRLTISPPARA